MCRYRRVGIAFDAWDRLGSKAPSKKALKTHRQVVACVCCWLEVWLEELRDHRCRALRVGCAFLHLCNRHVHGYVRGYVSRHVYRRVYKHACRHVSRHVCRDVCRHMCRHVQRHAGTLSCVRLVAAEVTLLIVMLVAAVEPWIASSNTLPPKALCDCASWLISFSTCHAHTACHTYHPHEPVGSQ